MSQPIGRAGVAPSPELADTCPNQISGTAHEWHMDGTWTGGARPCAEGLTPPEDREDHQGPESGAEHPLAPWYREVRRIALSQ